MTWETLKAFGFTYYEVSNNIAWISKIKGQATYFCFYCDGKNKASGVRGSQVNARAFMLAAFTKFQGK